MSLIETGSGPDVDFGALRAQASDAFDKVVDGPSSEEKVVESPEPQQQAVAEPTEPKPASLKDEDLVEVLVDGEKKLIPYKDAKAGWTAHAKFTKEMQALAEQRKQFEANKATIAEAIQYAQKIEQERAQLLEVLKNPEQLQTLLQRYQQAQAKEGEFLTLAEVQQREQAMQQRMLQEFERRLESLKGVKDEVTQHVLDIQETQRYEQEFDGHVEKLFTENPVLSSIDGVEELLRYHVAARNPQTMDEARNFANEYVKKWTDGIQTRFNESKKQEVIQREKLKTSGIEPSGGEPVGIKANSYKTPDGKIDWKKLRAMADSYEG